LNSPIGTTAVSSGSTLLGHVECIVVECIVDYVKRSNIYVNELINTKLPLYGDSSRITVEDSAGVIEMIAQARYIVSLVYGCDCTPPSLN
jgi:hypothetical protein